MFTGKTFRLTDETLGVETVGPKQHTVMLPAGAVVYVQPWTSPDDHRMLDLLWRGRTVMVFTDDLRERGEEVEETMYAGA
jgi:hypothetical protein